MVQIDCAVVLQAALFCMMNVSGDCCSPWSPFAFIVWMKYVFLPDVCETVFLSSTVCLSLSHRLFCAFIFSVPLELGL